jgi:hypothetical protein
MNPADNPDYGGPTRAAPMPNAVPRAGVDVPATVAAPPAPAAAQPAPGARPGGSSFAPIMSELAKQPGTGQAMMSMFGTDLTSQRAASVEERKQKFEAEKLVYSHITKGDWRVAKSINDQYRLGIPDEVFQHRGAQQLMTLGARMADLMGEKVKGATIEHKMAYMQGFAENMAQTNDEAQAHSAGMKAAQAAKPEFSVKGVITDEQNQVQAYDQSGKVKPLGVTARPQKWQVTGERATATVQNRDDMARRLKIAYPGLDDGVVQRLVVNPRAQITAQDIMRTEASMRKLTNMGRPLYKTDAEAHTAAVAAVRAAQRDAGVLVGGEGAPGATAPGPADSGPAGRVPPPVRMQFDSQGNEIGQ